jgi:DNA-directed RNA polymerase alpha subunit
MRNNNPKIIAIQKILRGFDLQSCKYVASWLQEHIALLEANRERLDKKIIELGLSKRAYNILTLNGINSIEQLLSTDWDDVKKLKGAGDAVMDEIRKKVKGSNTPSNSR